MPACLVGQSLCFSFLFLPICLFVYLFHLFCVCVCICICAHTIELVYGSQRTTCRSWLSPTLRMLEIEVSLSCWWQAPHPSAPSHQPQSLLFDVHRESLNVQKQSALIPLLIQMQKSSLKKSILWHRLLWKVLSNLSLLCLQTSMPSDSFFYSADVDNSSGVCRPLFKGQ